MSLYHAVMHRATDSIFDLTPGSLLFGQQQKMPSHPLSWLPQQVPVSTTIEPTENRLIQFDFLRATEMAALNATAWIGKGNKAAADEAACDAIRGMFDQMNVRGEIIIGEGIKDGAPGLFAGERIGTWKAGAPRYDIAIDPLDGTTNLSKGLPNAISCIAAALRSDEKVPALQFVPAFYMKKLAYPPVVRKAWIKDASIPLNINLPLSEIISLTSRILERSIRDVTVMVLDRPRNAEIIEEVRAAGASLRMITDGDISAALGPAMPDSGVDLYAGIGGAPEGILAAAGLRCMGGGMQAQMWPRDQSERDSLFATGWSDRVDEVYRSRDLVASDDILFVATGICDSPLLKGVEYRGSSVITHSVLMRLRSGTVRFIRTSHDLTQRPTILRSKSLAPKSTVPSANRWGKSRGIRPSGILLIGAPGSGKGTIGKALGNLPGFLHCSSGDAIRSAMSEKGARGERWDAVARGGLIADEDLWSLFDAYIEEQLATSSAGNVIKHILIDGIPRSLSQVDALNERIDVRGVIYLNCPNQSLLIERLMQRRQVEDRSDDASRQVIETRLQRFRDESLPLLSQYPPRITRIIDASRSPTEVLQDTLSAVESLGSLTTPDGVALGN